MTSIVVPMTIGTFTIPRRRNSCRCGWDGTGDHPCHVCGAPSRQRFYRPQLVALAGMTMKLQVTDTFACDSCWRKYIEFRTLVLPIFQRLWILIQGVTNDRR